MKVAGEKRPRPDARHIPTSVDCSDRMTLGRWVNIMHCGKRHLAWRRFLCTKHSVGKLCLDNGSAVAVFEKWVETVERCTVAGQGGATREKKELCSGLKQRN